MARREGFASSSFGFGDRGFALSYRRVLKVSGYRNLQPDLRVGNAIVSYLTYARIKPKRTKRGLFRRDASPLGRFRSKIKNPHFFE